MDDDYESSDYRQDDDYGRDDGYEADDRFDDLERRLEDLEQGIADVRAQQFHAPAGVSLAYALGMALAVVLSWSRNASILWCILHGLFSWGYVIFFAAAR